MEALRQLEQEDLLRQGRAREYVFRLSDILKRYAGRRFGMHMQEFTTEEALGWLRASDLERPVRSGAEWFFTTSDPVKFARWLPDDDTLKRLDREVRSFVEQTHHEPEQDTQEPTAVQEEADGV